jgi:hypothetical protein
MAVAGVFLTWIAQPDDQLHDLFPFCPTNAAEADHDHR